MDLIGSHLVPFLGLVLLGAVGLCGAFAWQLTAPLRSSCAKLHRAQEAAGDRDIDQGDEP